MTKRDFRYQPKAEGAAQELITAKATVPAASQPDVHEVATSGFLRPQAANFVDRQWNEPHAAETVTPANARSTQLRSSNPGSCTMNCATHKRAGDTQLRDRSEESGLTNAPRRPTIPANTPFVGTT